VTAIHQFVPSLAPRDAISGHALAIQQTLRDVGFQSEIYALEAKAEYQKRAKRYDRFRGARRGEPTWLLYHHSVGTPVADFVRDRAEPLIVDYHNITPASLFTYWEPLVVDKLAGGRRQLQALAPRARLGIADSAYNAREMHDVGYEDPRVVPIFFDTHGLERPSDLEVEQRRSARKAEGGADWLFVGRIAPNKCQHDVVKAFAVYRRFHDPKARLALVGGTSSHGYETALVKFIDELELHDAVELTGSVSDEALAAYYRTSDVMVVCSEHEGFCVPLLEAMHFGVPVVAHSAAAVPETLGDGGLLLPTKNPFSVAAAVDRVVNDGALHAQLAEAGRTRLDAFALARSRTALLDALTSVVT
jgi:glycosyltransferase involved in cell wall biosynthesis